MGTEPQKKLYNYAANLLARRSYYSSALHEKLANKGVGTEEDVDEVMAKLKKYKFINDEQYVRLYIQDQLASKPQGIRLLQQKLYKKGITGEYVNRELEQYRPREVELAKIALKKKARLLDSALPSNKRKEKLFRFLASRGFPIDTIYKILS